jgi:hypothetical protein
LVSGERNLALEPVAPDIGIVDGALGVDAGDEGQELQ